MNSIINDLTYYWDFYSNKESLNDEEYNANINIDNIDINHNKNNKYKVRKDNRDSWNKFKFQILLKLMN